MWQKTKQLRKGESKYSSQVSVCALGHSHRSKLEGRVCQIIQLREKAGEIKLLQVEDHIYLTRARIGYVPDFKCMDLVSGKEFHIEAKGFEAPTWPIKKKLWKFYGPNRLEVWKGSHLKPYLDEEIIPEVDA